MHNSSWFSRRNLRIRLTLWYLVSLSIILSVFTGYLYAQLRHNLLQQVDTTLQQMASQALVNIDLEDSHPAFQNTENLPTGFDQSPLKIELRIVAPDGTLWGNLGNHSDAPAFASQAAGYVTRGPDDNHWRIYSQPLTGPDGQRIAWLQVAQSLEPANETLENLRTQLPLGLPLVLVLAGLGGFFLADRALRPIDRMTRTARAISASDLSRRIDYEGPEDEVGRLAATFDNMLDRLQSAFAHERRFVADAAHELRTPLTALIGRIGVTLSRSRQPQEYVETLQDMEEQVNRLIRLSTDLLFIAWLEQGQKNQHNEHVVLKDLLGAIADQIRPLADAQEVSIIEDAAPDLAVRGDTDLFIRLFLNLIDNAIKHTPSGGRVTIKADRWRERARIVVSDTGHGIAPEHIPHLFERFYRVEGDRSRRAAGGAGLGLAIAHEIVRAHAGSITAESTPGRGTTFTVLLPLEH